MTIGDDLLAFSNSRDLWLQDLLRRVFTQQDISGTDCNEILALLKMSYGLADSTGGTTSLPLTKDHVPYDRSTSPTTVITSICNVKNVNQLAPGQSLPFLSNGITVVFGANGSGKTGYTRVLKAACRARWSEHVEPVLGNAYVDTGGARPEAIINVILGGGDQRAIHWRDGQPGLGELSRISVFDAATAPLYADQQNEIEYLPQGLDVLPRAAQVLGHLAVKLNDEIRSLEQISETPLVEVPRETHQSVLIERLKEATRLEDLPSEEAIDDAGNWDEASANNLANLESELRTDPAAQLAQCRRFEEALEKIKSKISAAVLLLDDNALAKVKILLANACAAREAANTAATVRFKKEPLAAGIGGDSWRAMFFYARKFIEIAEPSLKFPEAAAGTPCPLCQQPLTREAHDRLCRFHEYLEDTARKEADRLEQSLTEAKKVLVELSIPTAAEVRGALSEFSTYGVAEKSLVDRIEAEVVTLIARRTRLLTMLSSKNLADAIPTIEQGSVEAISAAVATLASVMSECAKMMSSPEERTRKVCEKAALVARKMFSENIESIRKRRVDMEKLIKLQSCAGACSTQPISLKNTELREKYITKEFAKKIQVELAGLGLQNLPIKVDGRTERGKNFMGPALKKTVQARTANILSEGEFRGLALACFLAEIASIEHHDGIVVDDPVSSLDSEHIRQVAKRLVQEARKGRQVIIFTHDLSFYYELWYAATDAEIPMVRHWLRRTHVGVGTVFADDAPWEAQNVRQRLAALEAHLLDLKKIEDRESGEYRRAVTYFYTGLRETWERLVEEKLLNRVVGRFQPNVSTQSLSGVEVMDDDHKRIWQAMRRASEHTGHDQPVGRTSMLPAYGEMQEEVKQLRDYEKELNKRLDEVGKRRRKLEAPRKAILDAS